MDHLRSVLFPFTLASLLAGPAIAQATWHVDGSAAAPGNGSPASPFASIQFAIDQPTTVAGDTVLVAPGSYPELIRIHKSITVRSSHGPLVTLVTPQSGVDAVELAGPTMNGTVFEGFTVRAQTSWSGIYAGGGTVRRCIVTDCSSISGIECPSARIEFTTVVGNRHGVVGEPYGGFIDIRNSIVWGNDEGNLVPAGAGVVEAYNAGFGWPGNGSIPVDPGFWNLAQGELRLPPGSPCIDAGDPASPLDPDGSRADIGALAFDATYAPGPEAYCAGKLNSQGCIPAIAATGGASASSSAPFWITATNVVPGKPALLILGSGRSSTPFQGATLCIAPPIRRIGAQVSSGSAPCTGALAFDMQAYVQSGANPALVPGSLATTQWWGRDQLEPAGFGSSLSDALYFGVAP